MDEETLAQIENNFKSQNFQMTDNNRKQALIPQHALTLKNNNGTAPGILIEDNGKMLFMLPVPPFELIPMFNERHYFAYLQQKQSSVFISKTLKICGGESAVETMLMDLIDNQTNPSIATYAKISECSVRLTAMAENAEKALEIIEPVKVEIYNRLNDNIFAEDDGTLESALAGLLIKHNLKIAVAESCTGGMVKACGFSGHITNVGRGGCMLQ